MLYNQIQSNSASNWFALNKVEFNPAGLSGFQAKSNLEMFGFAWQIWSVCKKSEVNVWMLILRWHQKGMGKGYSALQSWLLVTLDKF